MNDLAPYGPNTRATGQWIAGSLELGQPLAGACHVLVDGGIVLSTAEDYRAHPHSEDA